MKCCKSTWMKVLAAVGAVVLAAAAVCVALRLWKKKCTDCCAWGDDESEPIDMTFEDVDEAVEAPVPADDTFTDMDE